MPPNSFKLTSEVKDRLRELRQLEQALFMLKVEVNPQDDMHEAPKFNFAEDAYSAWFNFFCNYDWHEIILKKP
jgi:hypothetical protein